MADPRPSSSSTASSTLAPPRNRQYTHLQAQLAQLNAHLADTENLVAMTAVQAEYLEGLGGWWGGLFMSASKVLGEEGGEKEKKEEKGKEGGSGGE